MTNLSASKKDLYACSTYYHALIACIKAMRSDDAPEIAVLDYIQNGESLSERLKDSGIFSAVHFFTSPKQYEPKNKLDILLNYHRKNKAALRGQISFDFSRYENIMIFHDDTWLARYFKEMKISYRLIEDALDIYRIIQDTKFAYMCSNTPRQKIKKLIGYGYMHIGNCPQVLSVEVNNAEGLDLGKPLIEVPRQPMFDSLTDGERERLSAVFLPDITLEGTQASVLLMTEPYADDGLMSGERQEELFRDIAGRFGGTENVFIKPHPRDRCDYSGMCRQVLPSDVPFEIIELCRHPHFSRAVLMGSSTMQFYEGLKRCCDSMEVIPDKDIILGFTAKENEK